MSGAKPRPLGPIVLGTMRLPDAPDGRPLAEFLVELAEMGIDTHHSSSEYETYDGYRAALVVARAAGGRFRHVAKIAEPSWDHDRFDAHRFRAHIEAECASLGVDHLDVVQWLVRTSDPSDVAATVAVFQSDGVEIAECFDRLVADGLVGRFFGFPYTPDTAQELSALIAGSASIDGMTLYLNPLETQWADVVAQVPTLAIRPFGGGAIATDQREAALRFALSHDNVEAAIVSLSSRDHARQACAWAN